MIRNLQFEFLQGWPAWAAVLVIALVVAGGALFYRRAAGRVTRRYLVLLMALRGAALLALLLCLFRPTIRFERGVATRPALLILADTSRSMSIHDFAGQPPRFQRVVQALHPRSDTVRSLAGQFDLRWFDFSGRARPLEGAPALAELRPEGDATDLVASVRDAVGAVTGDLAGAVLLTDGINTAASNPVEELPEAGVPVFAVGVGSVLGATSDYRDIAIAEVDARREVEVHTTVPITVSVEATGFPDRVVPVYLEENGERVAETSLVLDNEQGAQKARLEYAPKAKGDYELTVRIPADPSERVTENNLRVAPVWVGDPRIRVLYVEGVIRNEYRDVRRVLERDPQVEILSLLRTGPNLFYQQGNITDVELAGFPTRYEELKTFKVLILGSLERDLFSDEQLQFINRFVSEGGGLMMLGGENSFGPGGYGGTPVEEALPVVCGDRRMGQERDPFPLTLTPTGRVHPIFAGLSEYFALQGAQESGAVPDLLGCVQVLRPRPAADVLAIHPARRNDYGPLAALAAGRFGSGRSLAATFDSTWLWYRPMIGLGEESPYVRYWGQAMRWLAGVEETEHEAGAHVSAYSDKHYYEPGMTPRVMARVTDPKGQVTSKAAVEAEIRRADEDEVLERVRVSPLAGRQGDYETELPVLESGRYEVTVSATLDGATLGEASLAFRVGEPTREFERLDLDEPTLRTVAEQTGGRYLPLLSLNRLPEILRSRQEARIEKSEIFLWNSPLLFVAFLLLVTGEWVLRKRRLLS